MRKEAQETLMRARALLQDVTPLSADCGGLCGGACCRPDEDGQGGVWLLPGEETPLAGEMWARAARDGDMPMLLCAAPCIREKRPFFCRIFPLIPVRRGGVWDVRIDRRARAVCPLSRSGLRGLRPEFVSAAREASRLLAGEAAFEGILLQWAALERAFSEVL